MSGSDVAPAEALPLERLPFQLEPDPRRVLLRPFLPSLVVKPTAAAGHTERLERLAQQRWRDVLASLQPQHPLSGEQRLLLGYYLTHEYALESAALFNPSLVPHPDQGGLPPGSLRVVLSLCATGEGHISSIEFPGGVLHADGRMDLDPVSPFVFQGEITSLNAAEGHYQVTYGPESQLSERVLFPVTARESNGLEDARFVRLAGEDPCWLATATAYDGRGIQCQLITTRDFATFELRPLRGAAVHNKGLAFFPRQIDNQWMLGRQDSENIHLMRSDQVDLWPGSRVLLRPREPWEFIQLGNCGSPLETEAGWLVLTHGVGAVREYCIGAALLDLEDPARVLGRLRHPLLRAAEDERDGYVPNVGIASSNWPFKAPVMVPVVTADQRPVSTGPKRISLPCRLPPLNQGVSRGLPLASATMATPAPKISNPIISTSSQALCRRLPMKRPKASIVAAGMRSIAQVQNRLVNRVGFS
ncbi:MAG: glycosidase [Cyanobacteria bacterium K_Offshore_surface_m2_239]|nr:glycosidase [Cyanobacteria bacterium K_Offshore_surface_m2_239]